MAIFRRSSVQAPPPPSNPASVSRSSTTTTPRGRVPTDEFSQLSMNDEPPPPDYNAALRASISGPPSRQPAPAPVPAPVRYSAPPAPAPTSPRVQTASNNPFSDPPAPTSPRAVPTPASPTPARGATVQRQRSVEDPFGTLARFDTVLLIDDSPSMFDLLEETTAALSGLVSKAVQYDKDGLDVYFLNHETPLLNCTDPSEIREYFETIQLTGSTPTGFQLDEILRPYVEKVEDAKTTKTKVKPMILIVITDGRADDSDMVKDVIIEMAQRLDDIRAPPYQLGVQMLQIGNDEDAAAFLRELDDDLKAEAGVRDIVDTTPYEGRITTEFILKAALGSVVKRLDNP